MPRLNYAARKKYGSYKNEIQTSKVTRIPFSPVTNCPVLDLATRRIYGTDVTAISPVTVWGTSASEVQYKRQTTRINFKGFRYVVNIRSNTTGPLVLNYACISFKQNTRPALNSTTYPAEPYTIPSLQSDGFFRDYFGSNDVNFSTALNALTINFNPINKDQYNVHMHKRCFLNNTDNTTWQSNAKSFVTLQGYVPIKKWIKYNDDNDNFSEDCLFFIFWLDSFMTDADSNHILAAAKFQGEIFPYWSE